VGAKMRYNRNNTIKAIIEYQKENNTGALYVFDIFTGKTIRKDLFGNIPQKFDDLNEYVDCVSWFLLHNLWHLNSMCYPVFINNEYLGMQTLSKGFMYVSEIKKQIIKNNYSAYIKNHNSLYVRKIIKV
jgi:hypothetical protein